MSLPIPNLDDRTRKELTEQLLSRARTHCPEWAATNQSDPGVVLVELFAFLAESLGYRINRIPEVAYLQLLQMLGVALQPPAAAQTRVSIPLTRPIGDSDSLTIELDAGALVVATPRQPNHEALVFTSIEPLLIQKPRLRYLYAHPAPTKERQKQKHRDILEALRKSQRQARDAQRGCLLFGTDAEPAKIGDALLIGFETNLSNKTIRLTLELEPTAEAQPIGILWHISGTGGSNWVPLAPIEDTTEGLIQSGWMDFELPTIQHAVYQGKKAFWLRATLNSELLDSAPHLLSIRGEVMAASVLMSHHTAHQQTLIGKSDGRPGQRHRLSTAPILEPTSHEQIIVEHSIGTNSLSEAWTRVEDFAVSCSDSQHYVLDVVAGEIRFGPCVRQADGSYCQHGRIPPEGAQIFINGYRTGGGSAGNVGSDRLTVLKTPFPYLSNRIRNPLAATGGRDHRRR